MSTSSVSSGHLLIWLCAIAMACAQRADDPASIAFKKELENLMDFIPSAHLDKDSLAGMVAGLNEEEREVLIEQLESDYSEFIEQGRKQQAHERRIRSQFDLKSGAHIKVQQSVQESMNDPNSFKHVSTSYTEQADHLLVDMHFRMPISPGVEALHRIKAKVDLDGNVLDGEISRVRE